MIKLRGRRLIFQKAKTRWFFISSGRILLLYFSFLQTRFPGFFVVGNLSQRFSSNLQTVTFYLRRSLNVTRKINPPGSSKGYKFTAENKSGSSWAQAPDVTCMERETHASPETRFDIRKRNIQPRNTREKKIGRKVMKKKKKERKKILNG